MYYKTIAENEKLAALLAAADSVVEALKEVGGLYKSPPHVVFRDQSMDRLHSALDAYEKLKVGLTPPLEKHPSLFEEEENEVG